MITRFAPSPTGHLHLGHAYSALVISRMAADAGGTVLLRIEDTDSTRCRPEFDAALIEDLTWCGFVWQGSIRRQSEHIAEYQGVLHQLAKKGLIYPCSCTRREIAGSGARPGWDGLVYPGTCRGRTISDARPGDALRFDLRKVWQSIDTKVFFTETGPLFPGRHVIDETETIDQIGDPVLQRKETGDPAYHLACPHDDALQQVTHVTRGADLFRQTWLHVLLQAWMGWPTPVYHHHELVRDQSGRRLAKIDLARSIRSYREDGYSPQDLRALIAEQVPV